MGRGDGSGGMLSAKKTRLEAAVREDLVMFQNSELEYFYNNYASIGTMAAIIAGFAYSAVAVEEDMLSGQKSFAGCDYLVSLYYGCACAAMGAALVTLITTTLLNIYGPGLALRGPEGSLKRAVDGMRTFMSDVARMFYFSIVCFLLTAGVWTLLVINKWPAIVTSLVVIGFFFLTLLRWSSSVYLTFRFSRDDLVTGQFTHENIRNLERSSLVVGNDEAQRRASMPLPKAAGSKDDYGTAELQGVASDTVSDEFHEAGVEGEVTPRPQHKSVMGKIAQYFGESRFENPVTM